MASLDQAQMKPQDEQGGWTPSRSYSAQDSEIATRMVIKMLSQGNGMQVISDAVNQSQDPAQVIGQFLAQIMGQLAEQLNKEAGIDPGVFLAKDGVLDAVLNYIEQKLGYPEEFSDQIYSQVLEVIKAAAQNPQQAQQANAAQQAGPPQQQAAPAGPPQGGM